MENRYLCRGRRIDNKEWVIGFYNLGMSESRITTFRELDNEKIVLTGIYEVYPDTIGQCSGLADKNDKLIFEGDILKFDDVGEEGDEFAEGYDFINTATVCWRKGRFELTDFRNDNSGVLDEMNMVGHDEFIFVFSSGEVIGNIHAKK